MGNAVSKTIDNIVEFVELKTEQVKLKLIAKLARIFSGVITLGVVIVFGLITLLFLSIGLSQILNQALNSAYAGYFIVAGIYFLVIVIIFILIQKKYLQVWFEELILKIVEREQEDVG